MSFVYRLRDTLRDAVFYVGRTSNIDLRFDNHIKYALTDTREYRLKELWIKHIVNFDGVLPAVEVIEECPDGVVSEREMFAVYDALLMFHPITNVSFRGIDVCRISVSDARSMAVSNRVSWARANRSFPLSKQMIYGRKR